MGAILLFLGKIPLWVYAVIAAVLLIIAAVITGVVWLDHHDEHTRETEAASWKAREAQRQADAERAITDVNRKLEHADQNARAAKEKGDAALAERERQYTARIAALKKEQSDNVTPAAIAACDLHRGVIVQFNDGADSANGNDVAVDPAAAAARHEAADEPSGISLDTYVSAIGETQAALGSARGQVIGWQEWYRDVLTPWVNDKLAALSTCVTKGTP